MLSNEYLYLLIFGVFLIATLYASVGHAGASGYIAIMSLLSIAPATIKPTALCLNILVASIAFLQFYKAGHFKWGLFWPFALLAIPCAYWGGQLHLSTHIFKVILGFVLMFSAISFIFKLQVKENIRPAPLALSLNAGAIIGVFSGLTGTGGGIFLTPLLLLMRWANAKNAAAVSALFVLVNSISGLAGNIASTRAIPSFIWPLLIAAALGGCLGAYIGSYKIQSNAIKQLLAVVLIIAGLKLIFT